VTELARIEQDIKTNKMPTDEKIFFEMIDGIRLQIMKRARYNIKSYILNNPHVKQEAMEVRELNDSRAERQTYQERIKKSRERARLGQEE
jgi:hypothetical protein